jgi:polyisoprenoid-binding protein YceI
MLGAPGTVGRHTRPRRGRRGLAKAAGILAAALLTVAVTIALVRVLGNGPGGGAGTAGPGTPGAPAAAPPTSTTTRPSGATSWAGSWAVRPGPSTFTGFRVDQRVAGQAAAPVVGRTPAVSGRLVLDGRRLTRADVTADLRALDSGNAARDRWLTGRSLRTARYPTARFTLLRPARFGERPRPGSVVAAKVTGRLRMHGVTRTVVLRAEGRWVGDALDVVGRATVTPSDWGIDPDGVPGLATAGDTAVFEISLRLARM